MHGAPQGAYSTGFKNYKVDGVKLFAVDRQHENDLSEPPHGRGSRQSLASLLGDESALMAGWIYELQQQGLRVTEIVLGQGLIVHQDAVREALATGARPHVQPSRGDRAHASDVATGPKTIAEEASLAEISIRCVTRTGASDRAGIRPTALQALPPGALQ
jgi:hypothetical protein